MHTQRSNPFFQHLMPFSKKSDSFASGVVDNQKLESKFDSNSLFSEDEDMPNVRMSECQQMQNSVFSAFNFNRPVNTDQFADEFDSSYEFLSPVSRSHNDLKPQKDINNEPAKYNQLFFNNAQKKPGILKSPVFCHKNDNEAKSTAPRTQSTGFNFLNSWKTKMHEQSLNKSVDSVANNLSSPNPLGQNFREKNRCSPLSNNLPSISPVLKFRNPLCSSNAPENKLSHVPLNVDLDEETDDYDTSVSFNKNGSPMPKTTDFENVIRSPSGETKSYFFSPKASLETTKATTEVCMKPSCPLPNTIDLNEKITDMESFSSSAYVPENPHFMDESGQNDSGENETNQSSSYLPQKVNNEASEQYKNVIILNNPLESTCPGEEKQSDEKKASDASLSKPEENIENGTNNNSDFEKTNLTLLHLKLKNEADKIRKWHLSVENALRSKEKQIAADIETISCLRKGQLDLKLSAESLSSQLKDEIQSREDFNEKLVSTRHLCNALKDHLQRVDEVQKSFNRERLKIHGLIESLKLLFEKLSAEKQIIGDGIDEMGKICQEKVARRKEEMLRLQSDHASQKREWESQINALQDTLSTAQDNLVAKEQLLSDFETTCNSLKSETRNQQIAIDQLVLEKQEITDNIAKKESVIQKYQEEVSILKDSVSNSDVLISDLQNEILDHKKVIKENEEFLKNERERSFHLGNEVKEHENSLAHERNHVKELEEQSNGMRDRIDQLTDTIAGLNINLDEERMNFLKDYSSLLLSNEETANELLRVNSKLNDAEKHIMELEDREIDIGLHSESVIATAMSDNSLLHENMDDLLKEKNEVVCDLNNLKNEFSTLEVKYSDLKNDVMKKESELSTMKHDLDLQSDVVSKLNTDLSVRKDEVSRMEITLEAYELKIHELEENLSERIRVAEDAEKLTKNKELEIEKISSEKKTLELDLSNTMLAFHQCKDKVSELEALLVKERESRDEIMKSVEAKTNEIQEIRTELEAKRIECEKFQEEHVRLKCELGTTLEHYESERLSILKQKEDEMEKMKSDLTNEAQKCNKDLDKKMSEANAKIEKLKTQLKNAQTNKALVTKMTDRNNFLENEIEEIKSSSSKDMDELRATIECLKSQLQLQEDEQKFRKEVDKKMEDLAAANETKEMTIKKLECDIEALTSRLRKADEDGIKLRQSIETMREREIDFKKFEEWRGEKNEASRVISCKTPETIIQKKTLVECPSNVNVLRSPSPTPIPKETLENIARTPKSPGLNASLWRDKKMSVSAQHSLINVGINELETPRRTPKSILKQPGSASKRRRVFFSGENRHEMSDIESSCSEVVDLQTMELDKILSKQRNMNPKMLQAMRTPKNKPKLFQQRNSPGERNLRKTPSRTPNTFRGSSSSVKPKQKGVKEDFWFDSDNVFGVINEY